ncbi:hypothetical protein [Nocardia bovistercoris]|uniref:DUF3558 domain-containing protein n=1 Tax=Nocardia bovistercoris TaxID=2785916 RepID=A0A931N297_9NOCA|nr:hypothetical protein [Nocardia bovistercoris]MBH0779270.1 hypothetical protein [Nocardia bovistercoris]
MRVRVGTKGLIAVLALAATACGSVVAGTPVAEPGGPAQSSSWPSSTRTPVARPSGSRTPSATSTQAAGGSPFEEHAVDNECVLDSSQISALAGVSLDGGRDTSTKRSDGTYGRSCTYYLTAGGILSFTATIKVMRPRQGRVTDEMIAQRKEPGARVVTDIGRAVLIEADSDFPQVWVFTDRFVATIVLVGSNLSAPPTDARWRAAARQIVAVLPS